MLSAGCTPTVVGDGDHGRSRLRRVSLQFAAGRGLNPRRDGVGRGLVIQKWKKCHLARMLRRAAEATARFRAAEVARQGAQARPSLQMGREAGGALSSGRIDGIFITIGGRCGRPTARWCRRPVAMKKGNPSLLRATLGQPEASSRGHGEPPSCSGGAPACAGAACLQTFQGGRRVSLSPDIPPPFFFSRPCHPRPRRGRPRRAARRLRVENERRNTHVGTWERLGPRSHRVGAMCIGARGRLTHHGSASDHGRLRNHGGLMGG